jgi:cellulose binding protein with CBM2 domain
MNDTPRRERRSPVVVVLDAAFGLAAALQTGQLPGRRRVREEGAKVRRGVGIAWLTAGILAAIAGTVLLVVTFVRAPDGLASLPPNAAQPLPPPPPTSAVPSTALSPSSTPSRTPSPSRSASQSPTPTGVRSVAPPPVAAAVPLTASYAADEGGSGLLGYRATVTITNPARTAKTGWSLTVTLPRSTLTVAQVSGATAKQDGATWTFTPDGGTARIAPAGTATVTFSVRGATLLDARPQACRIDGNPCTGLG